MDRPLWDRALPPRRDERLHSRSRSPSSPLSATHHHHPPPPPPPLHVRPRDPRTRDPRLRPRSSDRDLPIPPRQQHHHEPSPVQSPHATLPPPPPPARSIIGEAPNATEPRFRHDPAYREKLMRIEVVPLHELKRLRALKVKANKSEDGVVPIPVPLEPDETEREYEEALNEWLQGKGIFLKDLHDDPFRERSFRIAYANLRVRFNYKPRSNASEHNRNYDAEGRGSGGVSHVRKRSGSPEDHDRPPHKVYVTAHPHSNGSSFSNQSNHSNSSSSRDHRYDYDLRRSRHDHPQHSVSPIRLSHGDSTGSTSRDHRYDDDPFRSRDSQHSVSPMRSSHGSHTSSNRDHRYDDDSRRPRDSQRPVSPAWSSHGGSTGSSRAHHNDDDSRHRPRDSQHSASSARSLHESSSKRCKAQLPAPNASFRSFVSAYVKCYCFDCLRDWNLKLTERLEMLENEVRDLRKRVPKEGKLAGEKASSKDASPKVVKTNSKDPRTKPKTNGENQEKMTDETAKVKTSTAPKPSSTSTTIPLSSEGKLHTQQSATNLEPGPTAASSDTPSVVRAVEGVSSQASESRTRQAVSKTPTASGPNAPTTGGSKPPTTAETSLNAVQQHFENGIETASRSIMAPANPDQLPAESVTESRGFFANEENARDAPAQTEPAHAELLPEAPVATDSTAEMLAIEQSVKAQMTEEYNTLNNQILINERVLQDAVEQIQQKMATDMAGALREQEQIHQLRQSIVDEMGNRDAAMAMVVAYCWVGKHAELMDRITQLDTLDVPHVQRVGHVKCAELAARIAEKKSQFSFLKAQVAAGSVSNGDTLDYQILDDLTNQIALAEASLATLEDERMEQFMRLFQFSTRIRALCKSMLEEQG